MFGFTRLGIRFLDFVMLKRQEIEPFQFAGMFCRQFREFRFGGLERQVNVRGPFQARSVASAKASINASWLELSSSVCCSCWPWISRRAGASSRKRRNGARLIVDVNPIPFIRRDLAPDNDLAAFGIESESIEARR